MTKSVFLSLIFHSAMIVITALTLPFMKRAPIDLPPILSVDLIQITDTTSIPFAAKAAKSMEKVTVKEVVKFANQVTEITRTVEAGTEAANSRNNNDSGGWGSKFNDDNFSKKWGDDNDNNR